MTAIVTPNRQANLKYAAVVEQRLQELDSVAKQAQDARKSASGTRALELDQLAGNVEAARVALVRERQIRRDLETAYLDSDSATPDDDSRVRASMAQLTDHRTHAYPQYYAKGGRVGDPCIPCFKKQLSGKNAPAGPVWTKTKYGEGPYYPATKQHTMASFSGWDDLLKSGVKTDSEKRVLTSVAGNEGEFDQPQSYDSEAVSMGVMQKTVNSQGEGELPLQIQQFGKENPEEYQSLFVAKGWFIKDVEEKVVKGQKKLVDIKPKLYYKDPADPGMTPVTGAALKQYIRQPGKPEVWKKTLGSLREAGQSPAFQKKQVMDYNDRLVGAMSKKPQGRDFPIRDYVTSEKGTALVLDQSVNRPGYVTRDFGKALNSFFAKNPTLPTNPEEWPMDKRGAYETKILEAYGQVREMSDSQGRLSRVMKDGNLSGSAGSMLWP